MCERERKEREREATAGENEVSVTLGPGKIRRLNGPHGNCYHGLNFD